MATSLSSPPVLLVSFFSLPVLHLEDAPAARAFSFMRFVAPSLFSCFFVLAPLPPHHALEQNRTFPGRALSLPLPRSLTRPFLAGRHFPFSSLHLLFLFRDVQVWIRLPTPSSVTFSPIGP